MRGTIAARRISINLQDASTHDAAVKEIVEAFEKNGGNGAHVALHLGVSRRALTRWMATYSALEEAIANVRKTHAFSTGLHTWQRQTSRRPRRSSTHTKDKEHVAK